MENKYLIDKHENSESKYQITNFCPIFVIRKHNLNKNEKFEILWNVPIYVVYLCHDIFRNKTFFDHFSYLHFYTYLHFLL